MEGTNELWCRLDVPEEQGSASANAWFMLPLLLTSVPEDGTAPIKYEVEGTNNMYDFLLSVCTCTLNLNAFAFYYKYDAFLYTGTCAWGRLSPPHLLTTGTCFPRRFGRKPGPCINSGVGWG